jgi:hypothetical protein
MRQEDLDFFLDKLKLDTERDLQKKQVVYQHKIQRDIEVIKYILIFFAVLVCIALFKFWLMPALFKH